jgi:cytochrome c
MRHAIFAAAALSAALGAASAQDTGSAEAGGSSGEGADPAFDPSSLGDVGALYPAEGAGVTYDYCAACHSTMIVAQQGQTREGWDELLVWMVEEQGMQPIPEEDREIILDYLAEHYNTDRPHFPGG